MLDAVAIPAAKNTLKFGVSAPVGDNIKKGKESGIRKD